jgi:hypothetical protein
LHILIHLPPSISVLAADVGSVCTPHGTDTQASDLHLGKSNCETKLAYSGENLSGAREYYDSLIAQGYSNHQALSYTHQHFPEFQIADSDSIGTQHQNQYNQQNAMMLQNLQQPVMIEYQQQPVIIAAQASQGNNSAFKIVAIVAGIIVILVAITVVLAGVLYGWASDLANNNSVEEIEGTWYNPEDTLTLYPNGTVSESMEVITQWRTNGSDLYFTLQIDGVDIEVRGIYDIKSDDQGDLLLFIAVYLVDTESASQTNEVDEASCIAYSSSIQGAENEHFDERKAIFPSWCNPEP